MHVSLLSSRCVKNTPSISRAAASASEDLSEACVCFRFVLLEFNTGTLRRKIFSCFNLSCRVLNAFSTCAIRTHTRTFLGILPSIVIASFSVARVPNGEPSLPCRSVGGMPSFCAAHFFRRFHDSPSCARRSLPGHEQSQH